MRYFTIFTVLIVLFLSVLVAPMPSDKRGGQTYAAEARSTDASIGSCGITTDRGVSLSSKYFRPEYCGRNVLIRTNGHTVTGVVFDECGTCVADSLLLSTKLIAELFADVVHAAQEFAVTFTVEG